MESGLLKKKVLSRIFLKSSLRIFYVFRKPKPLKISWWTKLKKFRDITLILSRQKKKAIAESHFIQKKEPLFVKSMGKSIFDDEGRYIEAKFENFTLINCYFPNSQENGKRLDYKLNFCSELLNYCNSLVEMGENIVLCGDYNIAHQEIDLKNPKSNTKNPGFLPEERAWMTKFLESGYIDIFRYLYPNEIKYTWWSYRFRAREKNIGWRIDYHCVNKDFISNIKKIEILDNVVGSDHCPVLIELK